MNAAFAAYNSSAADQDDMASRLRAIGQNSAYHGHAGLGSAFAELAHRKLRRGGVLALVLPFSAMIGPAWTKFRRLIIENYSSLAVVSIAAAGDNSLSFWADTGMAECLVIARKEHVGDSPQSHRAEFTSLHHRPLGFAQASVISSEMTSSGSIRTLEDGPYGGTVISVGNQPEGEMLNAPTMDLGNRWGGGRIADASVAQVAYSLATGKLWLPSKLTPIKLCVTQMSQVGRRGLDSQMFISRAHKGPFTKTEPSPTATYPCLWNHDAKKETRMVCNPDSQLRVRQGMEDGS